MRAFFSSTKFLPQERKTALMQFCKRAKIHFNDVRLLDLAFHHRSYSNENVHYAHCNNERLEFLGDSVLGMVTATFLYEDMQENPEGDLARIKSIVVSEQTLAPIALSLGIDAMLVLGKGEELSGGRTKKAILADAVEAVIGAYYLDSGYENAEKFVLSFIKDEVRKVQQDRGQKDYKTLLQEYYQKKSKHCPMYELVKTSGPDHERIFWVTVRLGDTLFGPEQGMNKKSAEQNAAKRAYESLVGNQKK